jgi:hypothetical protein
MHSRSSLAQDSWSLSSELTRPCKLPLLKRVPLSSYPIIIYPFRKFAQRVNAQGGDKSGGYSLDRENPSSRRRHRTEVKSGFAIQPSSGRNEIAAVRMGSGIYNSSGGDVTLNGSSDVRRDVSLSPPYLYIAFT